MRSHLVVIHSLSIISILTSRVLTTSTDLDSILTNCPVLYLLDVEPYPHKSTPSASALWDRGLDVIPAGHLAAEQINNRTDILLGHKLELIDIESEACGLNTISKGVVNVFKELINNDRQGCVIGVIGLFCSTVTGTISPIVSHPKIGNYVQIASSTSPVHRTNPTQTNLFHILGSSSIFNEATLSLMRAFEWNKISVVYNTVRFYQRSIADDFMQRVQREPSAQLVTHVPLTDSPATVPKAFNVINEYEARISYWAVDYRQTARLLCEAYRKQFLWPGYVYIVEEAKLGKILNKKTSCSREEMMMALEGIFILDYRLFVENDTELVSGVTYSLYKDMYANKLKEFARDRNYNDVKENDYANSLYDQVWAFALAMNNSLSSLVSLPMRAQGYGNGYEKGPLKLSAVLKSELTKVSFQGASGKIHFGKEQGNPSYVDIYQIQNGLRKLVGVYDPFSQNITFKYKPTDIPGDTFETVYILIPYWLGWCILLAQGILFCLTTTNLVLILCWRKEREIKATSPTLSLLMMAGCYLLCLGPILQVVYRRNEIKNLDALKSVCVLKIWSSLGAELIIATLFLRLLRIYRIFCSTPMTLMSNFWEDKYLFIYTLIICMGKVIPLILWSTINSIHPLTEPTFVIGSAEFPHYVTTVHCICKKTSSTLWLIATQLFSALLLLAVVFLAIQTRHVKTSIYKDTKKVNVFIFIVIIFMAITISLWIFFLEKRIDIGETVAGWLTWYALPILCQLCLFVPKTLPIVVKKFKSKMKLKCTVYSVKYLPSCNHCR